MTGRVARAGRSGVAYSFIAPDEVAYVYDLHVFLGRPLKFVPLGKHVKGKIKLLLHIIHRKFIFTTDDHKWKYYFSEIISEKKIFDCHRKKILSLFCLI